jgi:hypothetical protein
MGFDYPATEWLAGWRSKLSTQDGVEKSFRGNRTDAGPASPTGPSCHKALLERDLRKYRCPNGPVLGVYVPKAATEA